MAVNADKLVEIVPRVISAGSSGLNFSGLFLSKSGLLPTNRVVRFSSADSVGTYFGTETDEYRVAEIYFNGYTNAQSLPDYIYFAHYSADPVSAWLRGTKLGLSLADLKQVRDGSLVVSIDGIERVASGVDFYTATSFSDCAERLQTALSQTAEIGATAGRLVGAPMAYIDDLKGVSSGSLDITIDGTEHNLTELDFTSIDDIEDVALALGVALSGYATVSAENDGLVIASDSTSSSSTVSYASDPKPSGEIDDLAAYLGLTQAQGAQSIAGTDAYQPVAPVVTYSSQTGAFQITSGETGSSSDIDYATAGAGTDLASLLNLTETAGATLSEGADGSTLTDTMTNVLKYARDWVSFTTLWEGSYTEKLELARWTDSHDVRFLYVMWDTDVAATTQNGVATAGYAINTTYAYSGTCCVYNTLALAAGVMGAVACLDFNETNGRTTLAYRQFPGVRITCDDDEEFENLDDLGYNCYGDFATAAQNFSFFQKGRVSGEFRWVDTYCNAIAIKDRLQLNILNLFEASRSIPYNEDGYAQIRTACLDTIETFINFGAIRTGVKLSQTQIIQLKQEVGQDVSDTLRSQGWYMQIADPGATARQERETPNCLFYYCDGGSIQRIEMSSTVVL